MQAYWTFHEELTVEDGLVLKGTWIVIPKNMCKQILTKIHESHLGLGKCKLQCTVYWLGINEQLEKIVLNCKNLKYFKAKSKQAPNMSLGPMDKSCHWHTSLWEWFVPTYSQIY